MDLNLLIRWSPAVLIQASARGNAIVLPLPGLLRSLLGCRAHQIVQDQTISLFWLGRNMTLRSRMCSACRDLRTSVELQDDLDFSFPAMGIVFLAAATYGPLRSGHHVIQILWPSLPLDRIISLLHLA